MRSIIFSGAKISDYRYLNNFDFNNCFIICADGGYNHAKRLKIVPDVILGDNDSYDLSFPDNIEHILYPPEKDKTDTNIAVDYAIEHGADEIILLGGIGGRIDQEYSHFCLMKYALDKGVKLKMLDDINEIWMEDKPFKLFKNKRKYVSFFPYGNSVENFTVKGLKYETDGMLLSNGLVQASSNEFSKSDKAYISFDSGTVLVMLCDDRL